MVQKYKIFVVCIAFPNELARKMIPNIKEGSLWENRVLTPFVPCSTHNVNAVKNLILVKRSVLIVDEIELSYEKWGL